MLFFKRRPLTFSSGYRLFFKRRTL